MARVSTSTWLKAIDASFRGAHPRYPHIPAALLEAAGLVRSEKVGRVRTCAIEPKALSRAEQWINARRIEWEHRFDRLGDYLKTLDNQGDGDGSGN